MAYIKSHSNYVLSKKHQEINDGTIWERDITTIGGVNQFAPGQTPIYKSGDFIITVRNDGKVANQYNQTKWKENESGETWTLQNISGITSELEEQNDVKIVLKQDYYDFCDFAYYGSLNELFRASINDVLTRFPGELYATNQNAYYISSTTSSTTVDFERIEEKIQLDKVLNGNDGKLVHNPFGIDIHSPKVPSDATNTLKYFADDGFKNYEIIDDSGDTQEIESWVSNYEFCVPIEGRPGYYYPASASSSSDTITVIKSEVLDRPYPCLGERVASIKLNSRYTITAWLGNDNEIVYTTKNMLGLHIRPKSEFIDRFYNECDNFEKILLDRNSTPRYTSTFSVIKENDRGYYRDMEKFTFPTSYGDYNLDVSTYGFNDYTTSLSKIGNYYDEFFTDNLYRAMTHEAIKNFDWSFTREFYNGQEGEYVNGGEKIQKALRVFAREFDEILSYINNIKNVNRVTYDKRNNLPDYFLIDNVNNNGWDGKLVYPYDLIEYQVDENGKTIYEDGNRIIVSGDSVYCRDFQLNNGDLSAETPIYIARQFSQNTKKEIKPYSNEFIEEELRYGYFVSCNSENVSCHYDLDDEKAVKYGYISAKGSGSTYYQPSETAVAKKGTLLNRVKTFTDERPYTYFDANNEFMRRLGINSPYIWRHKGTIEGIEMVLSMFGLKSKRWVDSFPSLKFSELSACSTHNADYEIIEYSSFTNRIEEKWDAVHQMYRFDWINSTKAIVYDNRSQSNYSNFGNGEDYVSYEGLPVMYRDERIEDGKECYIKVSPLELDPLSGQSVTSDANEAFKKIGEDNEPVLRRYLYPYFDKYEQLDGNPYFQMNGGWLSKTVENIGMDDDENGRYNFQFDVDNNIAFTEYIQAGSLTDEGDIIDNRPIYKETVRNIRRVDTLSDLITIPFNQVEDGMVIYVSDLGERAAIIDNEIFAINYEYFQLSGTTLEYVLLTKNDNYIQIGEDKFFNNTIIVYDKNFHETSYYLGDKEYGYQVKAYIKYDDEGNADFICKADDEGYYTIDNFMIFDANEVSASTNYFIIDDRYYCDRISTSGESGVTEGWRILKETDPEYIRINTITNYYDGNNPHNGNMVYDNGHEYFTYFKKLFKYASENDMFDERCYESYMLNFDEEIVKIGFSGLINDVEGIKQYDENLIEDSKIHYFGSYYDDSECAESACTCLKIRCYTESSSITNNIQTMYRSLNDSAETTNYILTDDNEMIGGSPYTAYSGNGITDEVTSQVVNNKRLTIKFFLHNSWDSEQGQCEVKYLDDVVMNYVSQMIPSTSIVNVEYSYIKMMEDNL